MPTEIETTKPKAKRATSKHPLLIGREPGVFHPDLVGRVPGYARTAEGFARRQEAARSQARKLNAEGMGGNRRGIPDGYAGRREEVCEIRKEAAEAAQRAIDALLRRGMLEMPSTTDDEKAILALTCLVTFVLDKTTPASMRTHCARTVLAYTKAPPPRAIALSVEPTAEDLLVALDEERQAARA